MKNSEAKRQAVDLHNYERWLEMHAQFYAQRPEERPRNTARRSMSARMIASLMLMGMYR